MVSARATAVTLRTYCRPKEGEQLETWSEVAERATVKHHTKLWKDAGGRPDKEELQELKQLTLDRKSMVAGRTLWLGGTPYAYSRAASQFNCAGTRLWSVYDMVDAAWLLLNGSGVGGKPQVGILHGYTQPIPELKVVHSTRSKDYRGREHNIEELPTAENGYTWTVRVGDSAAAWAKALGKLLNPKSKKAKRLVIDGSEVRGAGGRLKGYGWICNGFGPLAESFTQVHRILNEKAGELLDEIDIGDVHNLMGQVLSSRRAAEILHMDGHNPRLQEFVSCKDDYWRTGKGFRRQSNNSVLYWNEPSYEELCDLLEHAYYNGDPAPINATAAMKKCPWFQCFNPCAEIMLGAFCNLVTNALPKYGRNFHALERAMYVMGRANYRQTCVDLNDGVLQPTWHQSNEALRLCGVSVTGVVQANHISDYQIRRLKHAAVHGAYSMADELGLPRPKAVTCGKPEGCRPIGALTTTDTGVFTLAELIHGEPNVEGWAPAKLTKAAQDGPSEELCGVLFNGKKPVMKVRLSYGMELVATEQHEWHVATQYIRGKRNAYQPVNEFIRTDALAPGHILSIKLGAYTSTSSHPCTIVEGDSIQQPGWMTSDLAWLLGYFWGNGSSDRAMGRVRFYSGRKATLEKVQRILLSVFGISKEIVKQPGKRCHEIVVNSVQLSAWLRANDANKYERNTVRDKKDLRNVPMSVRASAAEDIRAFIAGLVDADGCASWEENDEGVGRKRLGISTAYERFADHLQHLAAAVGLLFSRGHHTGGENWQHGGRKNMWGLGLTKHATSEALASLRSHSVKMQEVDAEAPHLKWNPEEHVRRPMAMGKVLSVEVFGECETYDAEVKNSHWFYAGAVKSHNTGSKIMDVAEGTKMPPGRFVYNWIGFSAHDPLVERHAQAGYKVIPHPQDSANVLICFPVDFTGAKFRKVGGVEVDGESAVEQIDRYLRWNTLWADHNMSTTVSFEKEEIPDIARKIKASWNTGYIACAFMQRPDVTKTAEQLGHPYLPQEVRSEEDYVQYTATLRPVDLSGIQGVYDIDQEACSAGACPTR